MGLKYKRVPTDEEILTILSWMDEGDSIGVCIAKLKTGHSSYFSKLVKSNPTIRRTIDENRIKKLKRAGGYEAINKSTLRRP